VKREVDQIDAKPSKRLFFSIIADYDLNLSICELVDNAIDNWTKNKKPKCLIVKIIFDTNQQTIKVLDNAGGVKKSEIPYLVGPGQTSNTLDDETIGFFGVGTKRAVVAMAQEIRIISRYKNDCSYGIEFDDGWLETEEWELPLYEFDQISPETTIIEMQKLRFQITDDTISQLKEHLATTYAMFLDDSNLKIMVDSECIKPITFENWSYPGEYSPREYKSNINFADGKKVTVKVIAGLSNESSPTSGEYGVFFYCNNRLISKGQRDYEVGFTKGKAGNVHPSIALTKVIVFLNGDAIMMPWDSSKSSINTKHHVFIAIRDWLIEIVSYYCASLSRRWVGEWDEKVFRYDSGKIIKEEKTDTFDVKNLYLPPLPTIRQKYENVIKQKNKNISNDKPWTNVISEGIILVDTLPRKKSVEKNKLSLIILDNVLEMSFKEYLVNETSSDYDDKELSELFKNLEVIFEKIRKTNKISNAILVKAQSYHKISQDIKYKRISPIVYDSHVEEYRKVVQYILKKLFNLSYEE
jgi:DNA mismatch repair enzyme (predicted ATPase)